MARGIATKGLEILVAWQAGTTGEFSWQKGDRLRSDHPAVKLLGRNAFVPDGTPDNELPHPFEGAIAASVESGREMVQRTKTPMARAKRRVTVEVDGEPREISKGDLLEVGDSLVALIPAAFEHIEVPQQ
jgi:hypothetical protein